MEALPVISPQTAELLEAGLHEMWKRSYPRDPLLCELAFAIEEREGVDHSVAMQMAERFVRKAVH